MRNESNNTHKSGKMGTFGLMDLSKLNDIAKQKRVTATEISSITGLTRKTVGKILHGIGSHKFQDVDAVVKALGLALKVVHEV